MKTSGREETLNLRHIVINISRLKKVQRNMSDNICVKLNQFASLLIKFTEDCRVNRTVYDNSVTIGLKSKCLKKIGLKKQFKKQTISFLEILKRSIQNLYKTLKKCVFIL